ncbi:MAG: type II secretion system F family protein [Candidatus Dadabacteria bacterium]|nr:type II secretion system F family protein [Candidatus Dadabacteria bacterium]NIS08627.1 type II secretion system F family protein [Candidatus Dadabacteria bacterium]NIV42461.1 type II secretion system F family protein [Candidatus Dadabacteria bacterium]NIX15343.1 type II secretion system F family protein [Candidatus Dadabacteria bacterium]NIY22002.1 type II secretion system F family protein [Candidatus Dadabacteria bacterium]
MAVYTWQGRLKGRIEKGEMEAPSRSAVLARLRGMQIQPMPDKIKEKSSILQMNIAFGGIPTRDLVVFTRQLSTMIDAGLPLVRSLEVIREQQPNAAFKEIIGKVKEDVEGGSTFADALEKHPKAFDSLYANLARAGESGGVLDVVLQRLATYLEKIEGIKRRVKGAMIYPAVVISVAIIVLAVIMIFVVPTFAELFKDLGTTLPSLTQTIVNISTWLKNNIIYILIAMVLMVMGISALYKKSLRARRLFDGFLLKLWLIGTLLLKTVIARFCRTLATLTAGGLPILDGLDITAKSSGNVVVEEAIMDARKSVSEGQLLAEPLATRPQIFPPMVVQMISVGEQTGNLDDMLNKIADFYEDEVDVAVAALMSALEPAMIFFLGCTVGVIVISMYLPMFKLVATMAG